MSSCLSGGGRAYRFDLDMVKSPSTSSRTSHSSSPSSTLSESSNSPIAILTRKPRTPRKRPNQTYNEAAALLSTAYPKVFPTKHLTKPSKFSKFSKLGSTFFDEPPELLFPFPTVDNSGFLLHQPLEKPNFVSESKVVNSCEKPCQDLGERDFNGNSLEFCDGYQEDFDAESMLDEEIEEGIDSIMGNLNVNRDSIDESKTCYGYPLGLGFSGSFYFGFGMRRGVEALRNVDESNYWTSPRVDVVDITPKFKKTAVVDETPKVNKVSAQKKKKKVEKAVELKTSKFPIQESPVLGEATDNSIPELSSNARPRLKLNYDKVLDAWSDRGSPFPDEISGPESYGNDVRARLAEIDLFSELGGEREAKVQRYRENKNNSLSTKKIRCQVGKVNVDQRPRMKGRFVTGPKNSPMNGDG